MSRAALKVIGLFAVALAVCVGFYVNMRKSQEEMQRLEEAASSAIQQARDIQTENFILEMKIQEEMERNP